MYQKMNALNFHIPYDKWFTTLVTKGNTGSASIFIMIEELLSAKNLKGGEKILCFIPESGRFSAGFILLQAEQH
jgi:3-oxoacyl-[acyl-carrier-protein] synthase-3